MENRIGDAMGVRRMQPSGRPQSAVRQKDYNPVLKYINNMSTVGSVSIDESTGTLTIESLEVEDGELVEFLNQYDSEEQPEVIAEALTIGMKTMQLMDTSQDVEYVERRLGDLEDVLTGKVEDFQEEVEEAFDEDGPLVERLDEEFGEDGGRIQKALDPDNEGSPTYRLEERLKSEITSLRERIVEGETEEELRSQTYFKGGDFEDQVQDILAEIVRQTPNDVAFTGDTKGGMGRDVGDFVVNLADTGQDIVVEAKTESYSVQKIKDEMEEAIQNRDAAYGLFVTDTLENLPQTKTGWFHEFPEQNTVVVAMSEADDDEVEPGYLRIAFHWARMRAIQNYAEVDSGFDPEELRSELTEIEEDIGRFQTVRGQCTEIRKSRESIEATLDEIEQDIKNRLASIEAELSKSDPD